MKLCGAAVKINDAGTAIFGKNISNRYIGLVLGVLQAAVSAASLAQHVYSIVEYKLIFNCQFNLTLREEGGGREFLAYDIIIYDYGLFGYILGTQECIANYLDGGYMRCMWCTVQTVSLIIMIVTMRRKVKQFKQLWPALAMQSIYSLGLVVLALAVLPKLLYALVNRMNLEFLGLVTIYFWGTAINWFFTLTLWHYNWYLENMDKTESQRRLPQAIQEEESGNERHETIV